MKIKKVEIEAFRAYRSKLDGTFDFTNDKNMAANFVAIYAPNGFGKSSFYDAVEWAITNRVKRLESYQSEIRSTKKPDEGLKVLRNRYVDKNTTTSVKLYPNKGENLTRSIPKIRKNQNDMFLGDSENDYFRRAILSQDEIEGFLREEKPQDRYSKFMDSFGGDIETSRKELFALISENKSELNALKKQHKSLLEELKKPIDLSVFDQFNSIAIELNSSGEDIILPDENLSSQTLQKLDSNLVARLHELSTSSNTNTQTLHSLLEILNTTPEIELHISYENEQKAKLTRLIKGVNDADKYKALLDFYNKCVEDQKLSNERLYKLNEIAENIEPFLQVESRIKEVNNEKRKLTEEYSKLNSELKSLHKNLTELNSELETNDKRASFLRSTIEKSEATFCELNNNQKQCDILNQKINLKNNEILANSKLKDKLASEQNELAALNINSSFLLAGNIGVMTFEKEKIEHLAKCHAEHDLLEVHNESLHATQRALTEQMKSHERLISIGLDYLSSEPSHICPLCTLPHESPEKLISKVKGQNLLSNLSEENSEKIAKNSIKLNELKTTIQKVTLEAIESQSMQLSAVRNNLTEVEGRLAKLELDRNDLELECKSLEQRNTQLKDSVWGLTQHELITRTTAELDQLAIKKISQSKHQVDLNQQIQIISDSLKVNNVKYSKLESEIETKCHADFYVSVMAYINENSISSQELDEHLKIQKVALEEALNGYKATSESLVNQCKVLQQEMTTDATWVDFNHLRKEKETIEKANTNSQAKVKAFYRDVSKIINISSEDSLEQVKVKINTKISDCQRLSGEFEKITNSFNLLLKLITSFKPYIEHLSTQRLLHDIEQKLEKRLRVNYLLDTEMNTITEKLEFLINDFFFEDLINSIYKKIDPHPTFKKVEFKVTFGADKPCLNILVSDSEGKMISPILYFSAAQTNILSLSVFLANALHAKDDKDIPIDAILIDDPIQSMDSINILSMIDLLRSICLQFDKQLIISTHDENFFGLLQRKIPADIFGSKFLQLEKFGVVKPVEPICN